MSIHNRKFTRRNFSSEAAIAAGRDGPPGADPSPPQTASGNVDAVGTQNSRAVLGQMDEMVNHRGGCGADFAKEG